MKIPKKKLYGKRASHVMKTDIKEMDNGYQLVVDLPGFTKDEIKLPWRMAICTSAPRKVWTKTSRRKNLVVTSAGSVTQEPAAEAFM